MKLLQLLMLCACVCSFASLQTLCFWKFYCDGSDATARHVGSLIERVCVWFFFFFTKCACEIVSLVRMFTNKVDTVFQ